MAVEETKEQQQIYNIFRSCIYIFLICEIIVNLPITAHDPIVNFLVTFLNNLGFFNSVVGCKLIELTCVGITCIGSRPKKSLKFNVRRMVIYPACVGFYLLVFSLLVYKGEWGGIFMGVPLNRIIYASCSVFGIVFIHQAGDAISKYMRSKVGDDKFNFGNETYIDIQIVTLYLYLFLVNFWLNLGVWLRGYRGKKEGSNRRTTMQHAPFERSYRSTLQR